MGVINTARYQLFCARRGELESSHYHHARTASSCMLCVPTTRLASGEEVSSNILKFQAQLSMDGPEMMKVSSLCNGYGDLQHLRKCCRQLLSCKCSRKCKLPECQCMSNGLKFINVQVANM